MEVKVLRIGLTAVALLVVSGLSAASVAAADPWC
jgi:hypothetical protein